jgi:hypothetical protein
MSAPEARTYTVGDAKHRRWLASLVDTLETGWRVVIKPPGRTLDQNAIFHAMCGEIAKAKPEWAGITMDADDWKALLIVSHAVATRDKSGKGHNGGPRLVPDLEGEGLVQLRESSARMGKGRASSLIDYTMAWATSKGILLSEMQP